MYIYIYIYIYTLTHTHGELYPIIKDSIRFTNYI